MMQIPVEATAFLGVVGGFLVLLVVFLLYLNKMLCFAASEGLPCCDERPWKKDAAVKAKELGNAYNYEEQGQESSTDSDDEMLYRLQQSASYSGGLRKTASSLGKKGTDVPGPFSSQAVPHDHPLPPPPSSLPLMDTPTRAPRASTSGGIRVKTSGKSTLKMKAATNGSSGDLISLAEKGRVGVSASSGSSETSSPGTPDDGPGAVAQPQHQRTPSNGRAKGLALVDRRTFARHDEDTQPVPEKSILCTFRTSLDDHEEHLFDVSDLNRVDVDTCAQQLISKCGSLETAFAYDAPTRKMTVRVLKARDVPTKDRGGANNVQVRLLLLPSKKQKHKTKIRQGSGPCFDESFLFHRITPEEVSGLGVRFRLYGCERMRRERMIGESVVGFACLNLDRETTHWLTLEPRSNLTGSDSRTDVSSLARSDSTGSTQSMQHGGVPELLLGLAYNGTTGRLSAEVVKGSHFRNLAMNRAPDTYVKLTLVSSNQQEMARSKTSIRRGQPNPLFKETFMFQVALFQLPEVTLTVAVYNKRSMSRKEMIGWFALGLNSSGEEELAHWNDMRESRGEQVCRWHILLES